MDKKNIIKVYTTSSGAELNISAPSTKQVISATNNKAQYFAEQAKKYRDEAKQHRDNAKYYAEQNSDVTFEYIDNVRTILENQISTKQAIGDYALREELPIKVSDLQNDAEYVINSEFESAVEDLSLPSQDGHSGCLLMTDGKNEFWQDIKALNKTQITNCLLEVPQNINLELTDGVLTLKAGSKVIVPNGVGVFDEVNIVSDINYTYTYTPSSNTPCMLFINKQGTEFVSVRTVATCYSGITKPTGNYRNWYNTSENLMYSIGANATVDRSGFSLPIAIITQGSDGVTKSIDQVFNGFGYIGSTIWADKGIKGLKTNGRNADGSLRNEEFVLDSVKTNNTFNLNGTCYAIISDSSNSIGRSLKSITSYDDENNYIYRDDGLYKVGCIAVEVVATTEGITSFTPKLPFRAVDWNDYNSRISAEKAYITQTYVNGASWYREWSDGWCEQGGTVLCPSVTSYNLIFLKPYKNVNYTAIVTPALGRDDSEGDGIDTAVLCGVSNYGKSTTGIRVSVYKQSDQAFNWYACGYIA